MLEKGRFLINVGRLGSDNTSRHFYQIGIGEGIGQQILQDSRGRVQKVHRLSFEHNLSMNNLYRAPEQRVKLKRKE